MPALVPITTADLEAAIVRVLALAAEPKWLRVREAARLYSLGEKRIVALIQAGAVRGYKSAEDGRGTWFVNTESLDQWHRMQADNFQAVARGLQEKIKRRLAK
ncbi:MAG: hypothetical protein HZB23_03415 [Deltaproteobacteria bacterium]|nr:hypothetical protein [Deltaproteobacteria bacterium]